MTYDVGRFNATVHATAVLATCESRSNSFFRRVLLAIYTQELQTLFSNLFTRCHECLSHRRRFPTPTLTGSKLYIMHTVCEMHGCFFFVLRLGSGLNWNWFILLWSQRISILSHAERVQSISHLRNWEPFEKARDFLTWRFPPWMWFFGYSWVHNAHLLQGHSGRCGVNDFRMRNFIAEQQSHDWSVCLPFHSRPNTLQHGTASLYFRNSHWSTHGFISRPYMRNVT